MRLRTPLFAFVLVMLAAVSATAQDIKPSQEDGDAFPAQDHYSP